MSSSENDIAAIRECLTNPDRDWLRVPLSEAGVALDALAARLQRVEEIAGIIESASKAETVNGHVLCTPGALKSWADVLRKATP